MTRRDYAALAAELRLSRPVVPVDETSFDYGKRVGFNLALEAVVRTLTADNPRFRPETFYAAVNADN